jgi:hypothetical protein
MKTLFILSAFLSFTFLAHAQEKSLAGTWNITECKFTTSEGTQTIMQEEIASGDAFSEYVIREDGTYSLKTNMSGSGNLETVEGTWKTTGDKLAMTLTLNGQAMEIEWMFGLKDDTLVLSRTSPDGLVTVENSFRKD